MTLQEEELEHRLELWRQLKALGPDDLEASSLRNLGIYGGAQGIWVDKARTASIASNGSGVTVSLLHTGRHYPDDVSEDGLIYHYPKTARPPSRDAAEVEATKNASRLTLPIFVILPGSTDRTRRVCLGWVEDWDDEAALFLVLLGDAAPTYATAVNQDEPFSLTDDAPMRKAVVNVRGRQQVFRFQVLAQYGTKCAVCSITHPSLIKAAHIRGKREKGSDDWRNGIPLCSTHHDAYDAQLFAIHPDSSKANGSRTDVWSRREPRGEAFGASAPERLRMAFPTEPVKVENEGGCLRPLRQHVPSDQRTQF